MLIKSNWFHRAETLLTIYTCTFSRFSKLQVFKCSHLMSISLKVVSMAQVFWASFSLWAILSLMRFIFT